LYQRETGQRSFKQIIRDKRVVHEASVEVWDYSQGEIKIVQQELYLLNLGEIFRT